MIIITLAIGLSTLLNFTSFLEARGGKKVGDYVKIGSLNTLVSDLLEVICPAFRVVLLSFCPSHDDIILPEVVVPLLFVFLLLDRCL